MGDRGPRREAAANGLWVIANCEAENPGDTEDGRDRLPRQSCFNHTNASRKSTGACLDYVDPHMVWVAVAASRGVTYKEIGILPPENAGKPAASSTSARTNLARSGSG
jgi:hypothetical protein